MLFIMPKDIKITTRQRTSFPEGPQDDLETSIDNNGILHPPVVRFSKAAGIFTLVAGERRLRAMIDLIQLGKRIRHGEILCDEGLVPVLNLGTMTDLAAFEAELEENIRRENLSWQNRAVAEAQLMDLRSQQNAAQGLPPPTLTSVATEVLQRRTGSTAAAHGGEVTEVATRIRLAEHLDDPEVAKAKTQAEALKVVRRKQEAVRIQALATALENAPASEPRHKLFVGDLRVHFDSIPSGSVDVFLTDPPYGIDADTFGEQSGQGHNYADSEAYFESLMMFISEEAYRVCKAQAHAYVFCDPRRFSSLQAHFSLAGWEVWPIPLIWDKGNGMLPRPEHAPRRTYEAILYALKGDKPVRAVKPDVIRVSAVRDLKHGAQKPVDLYVDLLSRSAVPGDTVLDPCAGSGTIFPAANQCKLKAIGMELSPANAAIARVRMDALEDSIPGLEGLEELDGIV